MALFRQRVEEDKIQRGCRAVARLFPDGPRAERLVHDLPAHFQPEIRARRSALQMDWRPAALHRFRCQDRRAARLVLSGSVSARGQIQSLRAVRHHRGQTAAGRKISASGLRARLQFPAAAAGQAVAHVARRSRDDFPRVRPRDAHDPDARQILAFFRHQRAAGFCRGAVANAGKLGVGQKGFGQLCARTIATRRKKFRRTF